MRKIVFSILLILPFLVPAQEDCGIKLSGFILDKGTSIPLPYSTVFLEEQKIGTESDSLGYFELNGLCPGYFHLEFSHIGCEPEHVFLKINKDTSLNILLNHHAELLDEAVIHGSREDNTAQNSSSISRKEIEENSFKNLSDLLENITGVSSIKNGTGISKPVIHGLYGNRVAILNNGITQSGQQWGNDHAPEIDPFVADHLSVVKGASALAYGGNSLGSIVLVEAGGINSDPHLHGKVNYTFNTNGLGHTLNSQLEKNGSWAAWKISGTLKYQGDSRTPDYFLNNTGKREGNLAFQFEKDFNENWKNDLYISSFNTEIGVLRGSHISNLTDLQSAFDRAVPFNTEDNFSYGIDAPRQKVNHHLLKYESKYFFKEDQVLKFKYGWQLNDRKEFDIRRGNRSSIPALSLRQFTNFLELAYNQTLRNGAFLKTGLQANFVDNKNNIDTGILPLLPDYDAQTGSAYIILQKEKNSLFYEFGGRYDLKYLKVATISETIPRTIERFDHNFHNFSLSGGFKYEFSHDFKLGLNAGYMLRAPEVNELYSSGLHQGVSGIEEGNRALDSEKSLKAIASIDWFVQKKLFIQALAYYQPIKDFIFLKPQEEFRLTIRGAFPVFNYEQTDALLYGYDLLVSYQLKDNVKWLFKYAQVKGEDQTSNQPLVFIPANNISSTLTFSFKDWKALKHNNFSVTGKYVFEQTNFEEGQDFLAPPDAYFLLGLNLETTLHLDHSKMRFSFQVENALNTTYRDYLNRLRYFSDEPGINLIFNVGLDF